MRLWILICLVNVWNYITIELLRLCLVNSLFAFLQPQRPWSSIWEVKTKMWRHYLETLRNEITELRHVPSSILLLLIFLWNVKPMGVLSLILTWVLFLFLVQVQSCSQSENSCCNHMTCRYDIHIHSSWYVLSEFVYTLWAVVLFY